MKTRILWLAVVGMVLAVAGGACNCGPPDFGGPDGSTEDAGRTDAGGGGGGTDGGGGGTDGGGGGTDGGGGGTDGGGGGTDGGGDGTDGGGGDPDAGTGLVDGGVITTPDGGTCYQSTCGGKVYACGNCLDDDGDGRIDSADPDCLGPCHNNENKFSLGIPGGGHGNCGSIECYYDSDTGRGNDDCVYDLRCDPLEPDPACRYPSGSATCSRPDGGQSPTCNTVCKPITPNGCDCFGCCAVGLADGGTRNIFLDSDKVNAQQGISAPSCTLATIGNTTACRACTPSPSCLKACGTCQLCLGKTELPPECTPTQDGGIVLQDGGTAQRCPGGEQACGLPSDPACPSGAFCLTGCCVVVR